MSNGLENQPSFSENQESAELRINAYVESLASEKHPERNEDSYINDAEKKIFAVLDGVGGHAAGEVASREARDFILKKMEELPPGLTVEQAREEFKRILSEANQDSYRLVAENPTLHGMASTVTLVKLLESEEGGLVAVVGNVGDSRVYIHRASGQLEPVTLDDNVYFRTLAATKDLEAAIQAQKKFAELTDLSSLTEGELKNYKDRNIITGAIGGATPDTPFEPNIYTVKLNSGDKIIITSDGVHDNLTDSEIQAIVAETPEGEISQKLTEAAQVRSRENVARSKKDDITAVTVSIEKQNPETKMENEVNADERTSGAEPNLEKSDSKKREEIQLSQSFEELYKIIYSIGDIEGPEGIMSPDVVTSMIDQYRAGTLLIEDIPEAYGLRSRVEELDKIDKLRGEF